jgi:hypothetical protein
MKNEDMFDNNYNWANEYIILHESPGELIVLHRNMIRNEEFIIMTSSLISNANISQKFWCSQVEHHRLLDHVVKIKRYQRRQDNFRLFKAFFRMNFDEFIGTITA